MRKLFLTSAGLPIETRDYFLKLLPKPVSEIKLAFIPTAAYPEVDKTFVQWSIDEFKEISIKNVKEVDLFKEPKETLYKRLSDFDVIYVNGGNTFFLLDAIRKSGFDKIIGTILDEGKIYVGVSAGSIVAGPNIESAGWEGFEILDKNVVNLTDFSALNLVPFAISPHYVEGDRIPLKNGAKNVNYPIIAINDKQAVLVKGEKYEIVGEGEKLIYNNTSL